jgi:hypothetical protein
MSSDNSVVTDGRMGEVLSLAEARYARQARGNKDPETQPMPIKDAPRLFCGHCNGDHFRLYEDKTVYCAYCNTFIRNVGLA